MRKVICAVHSNYLLNGEIFDSGRSLHFDFLNHYFGNKYIILRHSLYTGGESRIYRKGINATYCRIPIIGKLPGPLRYISEIFFNFFYLVKNNPNKINFFGVDPLSTYPACLLKKMGFKIRILFLTPDYSKRRFNNIILNRVYFHFDKFCTINSDKNICNSKFVIEEKLRKYNLSSKKFFHMPNIPNPWLIEKYMKNKKIKNRIIYVGNISSQIDFKNLFDSIADLGKKYHNLQLILIGSGDQKNNLKDYAKKNNLDFVKFLGNLTHNKTLQEISYAEIGIAIYNGSFDYDEFRDSCKIREYQALGTIPLTTSVVWSNSEEIRKFKSGVIIRNKHKEIKKAIEKIISNSNYKKRLVRNCLANSNIYKTKFEEFYRLLIG